MVALLGPSNILHQHALYMLHHEVKDLWFVRLRLTSMQYSLPDPLQVLTSPLPKKKFKAMVKTAVQSFWHSALVAQAVPLTSLCYLRPTFLTLGNGPHPIWWTCGASPSAVRAATVQAKMLSGRYRSCWLRRHWTAESGACRLPGCGVVPGDVAHLVSGLCPTLQPQLQSTLRNLENLLEPYPLLLPLLSGALKSDSQTATTFILYPSTDPSVIQLCQAYGHVSVLNPLFRACRAWIWAVHRTRMRLLGLCQYLE